MGTDLVAALVAGVFVLLIVGVTAHPYKPKGPPT